MEKLIQPGVMAFVTEGREGIGAVRSVTARSMTIFIENAGEFAVPLSSVRSVHDQKVILDRASLDPALLRALGHSHDSEDPALLG